MIACQRTGTHLLRDILNSNPAIAVWVEPFSYGPHPMCWHNFMRKFSEGQYPPPTPADATILLDQYIETIKQHVHLESEMYGGPKPQLKVIGLDVKYEHIKCVSPLYMDLQSRPFLLEYFKQRGARVLHLVRHNVVHTAISIIIANARKVWQNCDGSVIEGSYRISPGELFQYIKWVKDGQAEFQRLCDGVPPSAIPQSNQSAIPRNTRKSHGVGACGRELRVR
jgi:hypothetical protein